MMQSVDNLMYQIGQVFLIPTLFAILILFFYAFFCLGAFAVQWWQRRRHEAISFERTGGFPLVAWAGARLPMNPDDLDVMAHKLIELPRVVTRVAPMLGLVATMIPMGPALKGLAQGSLADVAEHLVIAFSAVILALIAAAITYWIVTVRRRWLAEELAWLVAKNHEAGGRVK